MIVDSKMVKKPIGYTERETQAISRDQNIIENSGMALLDRKQPEYIRDPLSAF